MVELNKTYDEDGFRRRAGCVCFRDHTESEVLRLTIRLSDCTLYTSVIRHLYRLTKPTTFYSLK